MGGRGFLSLNPTPKPVGWPSMDAALLMGLAEWSAFDGRIIALRLSRSETAKTNPDQEYENLPPVTE